MISISGNIYFDKNRTSDATGLQGIANVPVVLQQVDVPHLKLAVYTDNSGKYEFYNVPAGDYRIVEAYGETAVPSPGDFGDALAGPVPKAQLPPISFAPDYPTGSTNLDCITPSTIFITAGAIDIHEQDFLNGPVKYIPIDTIMDSCAIVCPINLLVDADYGAMGTFPIGTSANTGAPVEPYPANTPDFGYVLPLSHPVQSPSYPPWYHAPEDGEYTVQNILNDDNSNRIGAWWRIADHTQGDETGRMMVVNGYDPGAEFFTEDVVVEPDTFYLFSAYILNLFKATGWADPRLGVKILGEEGEVLYSETLGALIPVNTTVPEWRQIGTVINSHDNTKLTVKFLSEGSAAVGNDYAIDDISLSRITVPKFVPVKTESKSVAYVGETIEYTITLQNTCASPLTAVVFIDNLPQSVSFVAGSVKVDGVEKPTFNPVAGFDLEDIPGGHEAVVTFDVLAESTDYNPVKNKANMYYEYTPVEGGIPVKYTVESNEVSLEILRGDVDVTLLMSKIALFKGLVGGEFTFGIFEAHDTTTPLYTAKNDATGLIRFTGLSFSEVGEFEYIVKEIEAPAGWEVDKKEWPIKIEVTEQHGELVAVVEYPEGIPSFVNEHECPTCGEIQFPALTYEEPGVYKYTLKELTPSGDGWTTDPRTIEVIVTVVDDGHGNLVATVEYPDGFPSFTNTYKVHPTRVIISGCKIAVGAPLPAGRFEFGLFDEEGRLIATTTNGPAQETK